MDHRERPSSVSARAESGWHNQLAEQPGEERLHRDVLRNRLAIELLSAPDGQIAVTAQDGCSGSCSAYLDTSDAEVLYAGTAPGIVAGVTQFNVRLGAVQPSNSPANLSVSGTAAICDAVGLGLALMQPESPNAEGAQRRHPATTSRQSHLISSIELSR